MQDLPDYHIDPFTQEPPARGCRFLWPDEQDRVNRNVFELSKLLEYFEANRSNEWGHWDTMVKHPMADIWCYRSIFLH